jgi:chromosome segregation ATPase
MPRVAFISPRWISSKPSLRSALQLKPVWTICVRHRPQPSICFWLCSLPADLVSYANGYPYIAAGIFAVTILPMLWYRSRLRSFGNISRQLEGLLRAASRGDPRDGVCREEARAIETDLRKLTGKTDIAQEDIDARAAELEERARVTEELRRIDDSLEQFRIAIDRLTTQMSEVQTRSMFFSWKRLRPMRSSFWSALESTGNGSNFSPK